MTSGKPFVPFEVAVLSPFVEAGLFDEAAVQVAAVIARASHCSDLETILGAALATRAIEEGDVCVRLDAVATTTVIASYDDQAPSLPWPDRDTWADRLATSSAVQLAELPRVGRVRPLVLAQNRLYLERYWRFEQLLADELIARATSGTGLFADSAELDDALDAVFSPTARDEVDLQRLAARGALTRPITVIAGGPGTGKTRTIAAILATARLLPERASGPVEFALAAPSAKAAGRISEAVQAELARGGYHEILPAELAPATATTIHRMLGARSDRGFHHDAENPMLEDLIIIDEASMVSLELMARVLHATRRDASLVLVGDPYQLASVEAGAVLGEIIGGTEVDGGSGPLTESITLLERTHRFGTDSVIAAFASAVRDGDIGAALEQLRTSSDDELRWVEPEDDRSIAALELEVAKEAEQVVRLARNGESGEALARASSRKVICGTRRGLLGVAHWCGAIESLLASELNDPSIGRRSYIGRPVLVTENDYLNHTFNGDTGIVIQGSGGPVVLLQDASGLRELRTSQLRELDTWWAMTIHKSQGSEFDEVVVSLPASPSPILSRELLYTAVTRARRRITIVASKEALVAAITRRVTRTSGLASRLWP